MAPAYVFRLMSHILQQSPPWRIFTPPLGDKKEKKLVTPPRTIGWAISYLASGDINQVQAMLELLCGNRLCQHVCCILKCVNLLK